MRYLFFLLGEIWTIIVSTCFVNIVEGDLIVAEFLVLVAVVHHQVVSQSCQASHNLQPRQSPAPWRTEVCNRDAELKTRNDTVLFLDRGVQHAASESASPSAPLVSTVLNTSIERFCDYITRPLARMQS